MAGVKGRSGRKSYRDEKLRTQVIQKAWEKKSRRMTDNDATQIVLKDMTIKTDVSGQIAVVQITGMKIQAESESYSLDSPIPPGFSAKDEKVEIRNEEDLKKDL